LVTASSTAKAIKEQDSKSTASKDVVALYKPQLEAGMKQRERFAASRGPVWKISDVLENAVRDSSPLSCYLAGNDAQALPFLEKLPETLQDWIFTLV